MVPEKCYCLLLSGREQEYRSGHNESRSDGPERYAGVIAAGSFAASAQPAVNRSHFAARLQKAVFSIWKEGIYNGR